MDQGDADRAAALIECARSGQESALNELIETWRTYLLYLANAELESELKAKLGASDLVQSACFEIQKHFDEFQGTTLAEWKSWLRQLLLHDLQDVRRRYRKTDKRDLNREQSFAGDASDLVAKELSPSAVFMAGEDALALREALGRLSEECRLVIRLRNWDELSFAEIGRRLNRSEEAARKFWSRTIEKLRAELARIADEP